MKPFQIVAEAENLFFSLEKIYWRNVCRLQNRSSLTPMPCAPVRIRKVRIVYNNEASYSIVTLRYIFLTLP
jgi:hypothetical protein